MDKNNSIICDLCNSSKRKFLFSSEDGGYYECLNCGLIYGIASTTDLSEMYSHILTNELETPEKPLRWIKKINYRLTAFEKHRITGNLLEIGCGRGDFLKMASQSGWNVVGVEISDLLANYARNVNNLNVYTGTIESVGSILKKRSFDIIYAANILEHLISPSSFFQNVKELLRDDGVFFATTLNADSWAFKLTADKWQYCKNAKVHRFIFKPNIIQEYCKKNSLRIKSLVTFGFKFSSKYKSKHIYPKLVRFVENGIALAARLMKKGHRMQIWADKMGN